MLKTVLGKILNFFDINFIYTSKTVFAIQYFTLPSLAGSQIILLKYDILLRDLGWKFRRKQIPVEYSSIDIEVIRTVFIFLL